MCQPRQLLPGRNHRHLNGGRIPLRPGWQRALRIGVKGTQRIHFIPPQLQPPGIFVLRRENVDNAAALTERTRTFYQRLVPVAQMNPPRQQLLNAGNALPNPQPPAAIPTGIGIPPSQNGRRQSQPQSG